MVTMPGAKAPPSARLHYAPNGHCLPSAVRWI